MKPKPRPFQAWLVCQIAKILAALPLGFFALIQLRFPG
jgi:hypothetical protein